MTNRHDNFMHHKPLFFIVLIVYLLLAGLVSVVVPLGEAPDEADHYAYARYLVQHHRLPQGPEVTQGKHPPLYHSLAALAGGWTGMGLFLEPNPDVFPIRPHGPANFFIHGEKEAFPWRDGPLAFHLARFLSVLLGGVTLWATWRMGQEAFPQTPEVGLMAAAFLAGLPGYLYISSAMNNDNAVGAFGALATWLMILMIRRGLHWRYTAALGLIFGLGLLSKVGALSLWPLFVLPLFTFLWPRRSQIRAWWLTIGHGILAWGLGGLIASPWLIRNWRWYGDPLGWSLVRQTIDVREGPVDFGVILWLLKGLYTYFWGRYGAIGQIFLPDWAYLLAGVFMLMILFGVIHFLQRWWRGTLAQWMILLLLLGAPVLTFGGIVNYTRLALGTDQARLLWPSIGAIALWFGMGLSGGFDALPLTRVLRPALRVLVVLILSASVGVSVLVLLVRPAFW